MMYLIAQKILEEAPKEIAKAIAKRVAISAAVSMSLEAVREGLDYWQKAPAPDEPTPEPETQTPVSTRLAKVGRVGVAQTSGSTVYEVLKHTTKLSGPACLGAGVFTTFFVQKMLEPEATLKSLVQPLAAERDCKETLEDTEPETVEDPNP